MKNLEEKLFNRYIGFIDERDEYQKSVIYKTLAKLNMYSFYLISILMLISLIFDTISHRFTFGTFALFFIQQFNAYYILIKLRKSGVDITEVYDNITYLKQLKRLKKQSIIAGIQWAFFMIIMNNYIFPMISSGDIIVNTKSVVIWSLGGLFFGVVIYFLGKGKLKKFDSNY